MMVLVPDVLLNRVGEALYGDHWMGPLSRDLHVNDRTIRYWVNGRPPPPGVWKELFIRLDAKRDQINFLIERCKEKIDERGTVIEPDAGEDVLGEKP